MKINEQKKNRLRKLLATISSEEEKKELEKLDTAKVKEIVSAFDQAEKEHEDNYQKLLESFNQFASASSKHSKHLTDSFSSMTEGLSKGLEKLGGTITTSYEKNKPSAAAGVYKDMINQLSS